MLYLTDRRAAFVLSFLVLFFAATSLLAQRPTTQHIAIRELSRSLSRRLERQRPPEFYELKARLEREAAAKGSGGQLHLVYFDDNGLPMFFEEFNLNSARTIGTDACWPGGASGFVLDGMTIAEFELGMWDGGQVYLGHQEFNGRIVYGVDDSTPQPIDPHSTHVAGTLLAAGVEPGAHGMAPAASMTAFDFYDDDLEMCDAADAGMLVSNHSYGRSSGWKLVGVAEWQWMGDATVDSEEDYYFGYYGPEAATWDSLTCLAPYYLIVKAAGNERNIATNSAPPPGTTYGLLDHDTGLFVPSTEPRKDDYWDDGYDTVPLKSTAKNILTVGSVADIIGGYAAPTDVHLSAFSSCGPADDGRVKPDIVANGEDVYSTGPDGPNAYYSQPGTSTAAPAVTGSCALLLERYRDTHGGEAPLSSTLKAIVLHTADEAGENPGPDYRFGWGVMDTRKAGDLITMDGLQPGYIAEESLGSGQTDSYYLWVDAGTSELRLTMTWTDPPGTPPARVLDPTDLMLVNDLDLRVTHLTSSTESLPWVLDPANRDAPAVHGDNWRDNVEQVLIAPQEGYYRVDVSHKGTLTGTQWYSLVSSEPLSTPSTPNVDVSAEAIELQVFAGQQGNVEFSLGNNGGGSLEYEIYVPNAKHLESSPAAIPVAPAAQRRPAPADLFAVRRVDGAETAKMAPGYEVYRYDDGGSELQAGLVNGGDLMMMTAFELVPGYRKLNSISVAWGLPTFASVDLGHPYRLVIYEDPNDDGDPADAVYLAEADFRVNTAHQDIYEVRDFPAQKVSGVFFVAALFQNQVAGLYPLPIDENHKLGVCWAAANGVAGGFDAVNLSLNSSPPFNIAGSIFDGTWLLRADARAELEWLDTSPYRGSVPAGGSENISVEVDGTALAPGVYGAELELLVNDPLEQVVHIPVTVTIVDPSAVPEIRGRTTLYDAMPNPFNPATGIFFELTEASHARLRVYDIAGRLVRTLVDEQRGPGVHRASWDGRDAAGRDAAAGVYLYRLEAGSFEAVKRMTLLK